MSITDVVAGDILYCASSGVIFEVGNYYLSPYGDRIFRPVAGSVIRVGYYTIVENADGFIFSDGNCVKASPATVALYESANTV